MSPLSHCGCGAAGFSEVVGDPRREDVQIPAGLASSLLESASCR
jgi:hypothetical protein